MSNLGTMTARLALDYSDLVNGLRSARGEMGGWQTYTVQLQGQTGKANSQSLAASAVTAAVMQRNTSSANAGLLRGTGSLIGSLARMGIGVATVYGSWKLHSIRMKNELMQNQLLTNMLGRGPSGGGAGSLAWLNAMRNGLGSNRSGMSSLLRNVLLVGGALTGLGAAAIYGYGVWRNQSAKMRTELMQQKVLAEQLRQMRSGGGGAGGGMGIGRLAMGVMTGNLLGSAIGGLMSAPGAAIGLAAEAEQTSIAFEVMLGSGEKAAAMLAQLKAYADKSPFDLAGANEAAKKLMNYGVQAQDVMPSIKMLGDVAAGDKEKFDRLSTAFGQTVSTGRLMGQDLLQFINAGFNPLQEISKKTGESMADLKKRMEDGGISSLEVRDAFVAATSAGGRFFEMTERQSGTLAGLWSTFRDSVSTALRDIGVALVKSFDLKAWLQYLTDVMGKAPYVIRNAGKLLQIEMIDWGVYLMDVVPHGKKACEELYAVFVGLWASLKEGWKQAKIDSDQLVDEVLWGRGKDGELGGNTGIGIDIEKGGISDWLTRGYFTKNTGKPAPVKPGIDPAKIMQVGEEARLKALQSFKLPGSSVSEQLTNRKKDLLAQITNTEVSIPKLDIATLLGGEPGASFTDSVRGKEKKAFADTAQSTAALRGSEAAAKIFTSGLNRDREVKILETIAKNTAPKNPFAPPEPPTPGQAIPIELGVINF